MAALDILSVAGRNVAEGWGSRRFRGLIGGFGVVSGLFRSPRGNPGDVGNRVPEGHGWSPPCARGGDSPEVMHLHHLTVTPVRARG